METIMGFIILIIFLAGIISLIFFVFKNYNKLTPNFEEDERIEDFSDDNISTSKINKESNQIYTHEFEGDYYIVREHPSGRLIKKEKIM